MAFQIHSTIGDKLSIDFLFILHFIISPHFLFCIHYPASYILGEYHNAPQLSAWCKHFMSTNYNDLCRHQGKQLKSSLDEESLNYIEQNRWPPVWYLKERDYYDRTVKQMTLEQDRRKKEKKRKRTWSCLYCSWDDFVPLSSFISRFTGIIYVTLLSCSVHCSWIVYVPLLSCFSLKMNWLFWGDYIELWDWNIFINFCVDRYSFGCFYGSQDFCQSCVVIVFLLLQFMIIWSNLHVWFFDVRIATGCICTAIECVCTAIEIFVYMLFKNCLYCYFEFFNCVVCFVNATYFLKIYFIGI